MTFLPDKIPFSVKTSNISSIANFSSTLDDAYILLIANNCNVPVINTNSYDNVYNSFNNAGLFGVKIIDYDNNNIEPYISIKKYDTYNKIAKFNNDYITFNALTYFNGDILPSNNNYNIGSKDNKWSNLYLSGDLFVPTIYTCNIIGISNLGVDFNSYSTSYLKEGSNLYFTNDRVLDLIDYSFNSITIDNIKQGNINKYIISNIYNDDLIVTGKLIAKNIEVVDNLDNYSILYNTLNSNTLTTSNYIHSLYTDLYNTINILNTNYSNLLRELINNSNEISSLKNNVSNLSNRVYLLEHP